MIIEINKLVDCRPSKKNIQSLLAWTYKSAKSKKVIDNLSVAIVDKKIIKSLNKQYRKKDVVTDVLSFNDPFEIIICWDQVVKQARERAHSQERELRLILVHGLLHILGYSHNTKKFTTVMNKKTQEILK